MRKDKVGSKEKKRDRQEYSGWQGNRSPSHSDFNENTVPPTSNAGTHIALPEFNENIALASWKSSLAHSQQYHSHLCASLQ